MFESSVPVARKDFDNLSFTNIGSTTKKKEK